MSEKKINLLFIVIVVVISGFVFFSLGVTAAWKWGFPKAGIRVEYPVYYEEASTTTEIPFSGTVNLNTATIEDLMQIEGIGEKTARNIIEYRDKLGKYTFLEQLLDVEGIGEKKLDAWKPYLFLSESDTTVVQSTTTALPSTTSTTVFTGVLNLNTASKEELMLIDGIGEKTADKIIAYRESIGQFTSLEQLLEIEGIGDKKLALWRRYLKLKDD